MPLERRREIRKGVNKGQNIFNKSRLRLRPRLTDLIKEKSGNAAISTREFILFFMDQL